MRAWLPIVLGLVACQGSVSRRSGAGPAEPPPPTGTPVYSLARGIQNLPTVRQGYQLLADASNTVHLTFRGNGSTDQNRCPAASDCEFWGSLYGGDSLATATPVGFAAADSFKRTVTGGSSRIDFDALAFQAEKGIDFTINTAVYCELYIDDLLAATTDVSLAGGEGTVSPAQVPFGIR